MGLFGNAKQELAEVMPDVQWTIEKRQLSELHLFEENPRIISSDAFDTLKAKIKKQGFHGALVIDLDGTILGGNQRFRALKDLGYTEINCVVPSRKLSETEQKEVALTDNKHDGEWNLQDLANFAPDEMLVDLGFVNSELKDFKPAFNDDAEDEDQGKLDEKSAQSGIVTCPNCQFEFKPEKKKAE